MHDVPQPSRQNIKGKGKITSTKILVCLFPLINTLQVVLLLPHGNSSISLIELH